MQIRRTLCFFPIMGTLIHFLRFIDIQSQNAETDRQTVPRNRGRCFLNLQKIIIL